MKKEEIKAIQLRLEEEIKPDESRPLLVKLSNNCEQVADSISELNETVTNGYKQSKCGLFRLWKTAHSLSFDLIESQGSFLERLKLAKMCIVFEKVDLHDTKVLFGKLNSVFEQLKKNISEPKKLVPHVILVTELKHLVLLADSHFKGLRRAIQEYEEAGQLCKFVECRYISLLSQAMLPYVGPFKRLSEHLLLASKQSSVSVQSLFDERLRIPLLKSLSQRLEGIIMTIKNRTAMRGVGHNYWSLTRLQKLGHMISGAKSLVRAGMIFNTDYQELLVKILVKLQSIARYMPSNIYELTVSVGDKEFERNVHSIFCQVWENRRELDELTSQLEVICVHSSMKEIFCSDEKRAKSRPTATEMARRNKAVAYAAGEIKLKCGRLPNVDEIIKATKYTRQEIYATSAYLEGKIVKQSAKRTKDLIGSATESEQFKDKSTEHARTDRRSESQQAELDALMDEQEQDDGSNRIPTEKHPDI